MIDSDGPSYNFAFYANRNERIKISRVGNASCKAIAYRIDVTIFDSIVDVIIIFVLIIICLCVEFWGSFFINEKMF